MHILYVDDSGNVDNPKDDFFILGGVAVFERGVYHLILETDQCVKDFDLGPPDDIEIHASHMYSGKKGVWKKLQRGERESHLQSSLSVLTRHRASVRLFAIAVDKAGVSPRDPVELAFEELCNRFNLFLQRHHNRTGENQRGLIIMDKFKYERPLQKLARNFREIGARWGHFRYLAEVPVFVDSKESRIIQLADLVAWATKRKYQDADGRFFDSLVPKFDEDGGVIHGLYHARGNLDAVCYCPACFSRKQRDFQA